MKTAVISFTKTGNDCNARILSALKAAGHEAEGFSAFRHKNSENQEKSGIIRVISARVSEWTKEAFKQYDALIFVGAAAIAVRSIAPCLKDKLADPAVIVADEKGQYMIPLLSGHVGGANALARQLAEKLHALPVITTATDIHGLFAVDVFAVRNQLVLTERQKAKKISAAILEHEDQRVYIDPIIEKPTKLPQYLHLTDECMQADIVIDYHRMSEQVQGLQLIPKEMLWLGIGCKKGTEAAKIETEMQDFLIRHGIDERAIAGLASIDVKAHEAGILEVCRNHDWPFQTFSAETLRQQKGNFTASAFVSSQVGVDNVCERAAMCAANAYGESDAQLLIRKEIAPGMTLAAAIRRRRLEFE